jgi:hypothetical protein
VGPAGPRAAARRPPAGSVDGDDPLPAVALQPDERPSGGAVGLLEARDDELENDAGTDAVASAREERARSTSNAHAYRGSATDRYVVAAAA